jgi:AraC-like DNA-binding protein
MMATKQEGIMDYARAPQARLRPFIKTLWVADGHGAGDARREHVLPTGDMHLVFRLSGPALRTFSSADDEQGSLWRGPVVGGVRDRFYIKQCGAPVYTVGVQLRPAAAPALFGVSAAELAGRHTLLADVWQGQADSLLQQLHEADGPLAQLALLEAALAARLPAVHGLHPAVARLLAGAAGDLHERRIDQLVQESRYSHRGFLTLFRAATGYSPKRYARLMRFQALLAALRGGQELRLADLAQAAGYSDQAHMQREFRAFSGLTPLQYRRQAPVAAHHVALASNLFNTGR